MQIQTIILPKAGPSHVLLLKDNEFDTNVSDNEVLIKTSFSGLNFADIHMRQGLYPDAPKFPFVPGYEVSGIVLDVGRNIDKGLIGKRVMAGCYFGGYSSVVKVPMNQVFEVPEAMSLQEAASVPVSFLTAYFTLYEMGRVRSGDKLLVDCASGSLGSYLIQLLKTLDVEVVGLTSSKNKVDYVTGIGYRAMTFEQFSNTDETFNFIINTRGGKSISNDYKRLNMAGRIVCLGASGAIKAGARNWVSVLKTVLRMPRFSAVKLMNDNRIVAGANLLKVFENPRLISNMMSKISEFQLEPRVDKVFEAKNVSQAHHYLESRKSKGKVLLSWND